MLAGAIMWLLFDLPLAWLLGPATIGLMLATRDRPIGTDYFFGDSGRGLLGVAIGASITHEHIDWMLDHPRSGYRVIHLRRARWWDRFSVAPSILQLGSSIRLVRGLPGWNE